ncbi:MAG: hypothetical protein LUH10_18540 [Tannerellaceae bacterium]|nr:hypothetical protein [Tannerellaceae bacterium]
MAIFQQQAQAILNYAYSNIPRQQLHDIYLNARIQTGGPCGSFACALIENATGQQIINQRNDIFNQDQDVVDQPSVSTFIFILDFQTFINFPVGSIIGIYSIRHSRIVHYVVKLDSNVIVGINHGGDLVTRQANLGGLFTYILDGDFNNGDFIYDNQNCLLLGFDYTLQ